MIAMAVLFGVAVRLGYLMRTDFPINDGGLFYTMIRDLQANGYRLPVYTSYNQANIPYAYPPLGFYLAGGINSLFGTNLFTLLRILPFLFNILTIPVFYFFAGRVIKPPEQVGLATLFFALLKPVYEWQIMGGGLTRSLGLFFSILTLFLYLRLLQSSQNRIRDILFTGLAAALTALSHLELAWFTAYSMVLLWFFFGRSCKNLISSVGVMVCALLATSPYWVAVIANHSLEPFVRSFQSGDFQLLFPLLHWLRFDFSQEFGFPLLAALTLLGLFLSIFRKDFFWAVWMVCNVLLIPRSVNRYDALPAAFLITAAITEGIFPLWREIRRGLDDTLLKPSSQQAGYTGGQIAVLGLICLQVLLANFISQASDQPLNHTLSQGDREAMQWARLHTERDAVFLVLPSSDLWATDPVTEWFPALAERKNLTTVQGYEWMPEFQKKMQDYAKLHDLIAVDLQSDSDLLPQVTSADYLFVSQMTASLIKKANLSDHQIVYENQDAVIYSLVTP